MRLKYKTRGMSNPKGKPKVYFSCHPDDFEKAFPLVSEDLLRHANCAVWYDEEPGLPADEREREDNVKEMQLVVFAVTSRFLYEQNQARDRELPLAQKLHVPVLPILLENDLELEFNRICAEIQVVPKYGTDPTATPYEEVLQTFLDSVLVGDDLAEKVRAAFDAYVFLSYRKKDRRHAQRLMRLIHENKEFRDIAIWYDEFLVPGEGFNEAIQDAFAKSSLFAMAVTPHLEEKENYVMSVEYPMARDRRNESNDFEIVPVEMYEPEDAVEGKDWRLDPARLKDHGEFRYQDIPDLKDEHRRSELDQTFVDALARIAKKEHDVSAQHRFFIGLAYLSGIDVEIDQERALELLTGAATDPVPCMEATSKLADMYRNGEGVPVDLAKAIQWQERLAGQYRHAYDENHDPDEHKGYGTLYFKALRKLSDMYRDTGNLQAAMEAAEQAFAFCEELEQEVGVREQERDKALILNRLGSLNREAGDYEKAEDCFGKAARIYEKQTGEIGTQRARRDLSISYERLGDISRKKGKPDQAEDYYSKAKAIREQLCEAVPSARSRRDLSVILTKLGNIHKSKRDYVGAGKYYVKALSFDEVLVQEVKSPQAWDDYGVSLVKIGDIHKAEGSLENAADCYRKACEIFAENVEKTGSRIYQEHNAGGLEKLASAIKKLGDTKEAGTLYKDAAALREQIYAVGKTVSSAHALAVSCYNAAAFFKDRDMMKRAYEIWDEISRKHPEYSKYRDKAADKLGIREGLFDRYAE